MRFGGWKACGIGVQIRSGNYSVRINRSHQKKLDIATDITREIYETAAALFDELWDGRTGLRLIGIQLFCLTKEDTVQTDLFGNDRKREKMEKADRALDAIRKKYGLSSVSQGFRSDNSRIGRKYRGEMEEKNWN